MHSLVMEGPTWSWVRAQVNTDLGWEGVSVAGGERGKDSKSWRMERTELSIFIPWIQKPSVRQYPNIGATDAQMANL